MTINKIYIICIDKDKQLDVIHCLLERNKDFVVANQFTTAKEYADIDMSDKYLYYISEEQLNLDFKNNALLYVITDSDTQESNGIAIDEFYNSKIIPLSIKAFNLVKKENLENSLFVWFDTPMNKSDYSKIDYHVNMIEAKYLLNNINKIQDSFLYFSPKDDLKESIDIIMSFFNGDDKTRKQIIKENS